MKGNRARARARDIPYKINVRGWTFSSRGTTSVLGYVPRSPREVNLAARFIRAYSAVIAIDTTLSSSSLSSSSKLNGRAFLSRQRRDQTNDAMCVCVCVCVTVRASEKLDPAVCTRFATACNGDELNSERLSARASNVRTKTLMRIVLRSTARTPRYQMRFPFPATRRKTVYVQRFIRSRRILISSDVK